MNLLPEVLIGGYPNSGTSFLCHLIVQLGKSPGSQKNLKGPDEHNRWGYFEHLPLRKLVWEAGDFQQFTPHIKGFLPAKPLDFDDKDELRSSICAIASEDNVEVYKDNSLPLTFRLFPKGSKFLIITRQVGAVYTSPRKAGMPSPSYTLEELQERHSRYQELVSVMKDEVDCLTVRYEEFNTQFEKSLKRICDHLTVELNENRYLACRRIFRPRRS